MLEDQRQRLRERKRKEWSGAKSHALAGCETERAFLSKG